MIHGEVDSVTVPAKPHTRDGDRARPAIPGGADVRLRMRAIGRLALREVAAAVRGPSLYVMITLGCLAAAVVIKSYLDFVADAGTLVLAEPLNGPLLVAILAMTGYVGLHAAGGLAGERERGTLEVLFYGPVDAPAFIGGKLAGLLLTYALAIGGLTAFLLVASVLTGFPLGLPTLLLLGASVIPAGSMIALGLLIAALLGRLRPALALMVLVVVILAGVAIGDRLAATATADTPLGSAAGMLSILATLTDWVSPLRYLWRAQEAFALGGVGDGLISLASALAFGLGLTAVATWALRRRGVQRWRE